MRTRRGPRRSTRSKATDTDRFPGKGAQRPPHRNSRRSPPKEKLPEGFQETEKPPVGTPAHLYHVQKGHSLMDDDGKGVIVLEVFPHDLRVELDTRFHRGEGSFRVSRSLYRYSNYND